jgi:hypothetical protein
MGLTRDAEGELVETRPPTQYAQYAAHFVMDPAPAPGSTLDLLLKSTASTFRWGSPRWLSPISGIQLAGSAS